MSYSDDGGYMDGNVKSNTTLFNLFHKAVKAQDEYSGFLEMHKLLFLTWMSPKLSKKVM
ncbi:MAG: hypothetical protein HUJ51_01605 [Eggerthellaceae bacterium]|nr:hypothetical protein [Eggerthellaceae bacterium]